MMLVRDGKCGRRDSGERGGASSGDTGRGMWWRGCQRRQVIKQEADDRDVVGLLGSATPRRFAFRASSTAKEEEKISKDGKNGRKGSEEYRKLKVHTTNPLLKSSDPTASTT